MMGLGLALAQPKLPVVVITGDGEMLMGLGSLATVGLQKPTNLSIIVLDNECYATTGGQPVPNAKHVAYELMARGAGYPQAHAFTQLDAFKRELPGILAAKGPVLVAAKVLPEIENEPISRRVRWRKRTADQVVRELRASTSPG